MNKDSIWGALILSALIFTVFYFTRTNSTDTSTKSTKTEQSPIASKRGKAPKKNKTSEPAVAIKKSNSKPAPQKRQKLKLGIYTGLSFFPSSFPSHSITIQPDGANYKGFFTECAFCRKAGKSYPLMNIKSKAGKISFIAGPYTFEGKIIKDYFEGTLINGGTKEPFGFAPGGAKDLPWNFGDF